MRDLRARMCVRVLCQTTKPSLTQYWELGAAISRETVSVQIEPGRCLEFVLKPRRCQLSAALPERRERSVSLPSRNERVRRAHVDTCRYDRCARLDMSFRRDNASGYPAPLAR